MFQHRLTVQLRDTDAYSILFFANQFGYCQQVFQAFLKQIGIPLPPDRARCDHIAVVRHAEGEYLGPVQVGDEIDAAYTCARLGTTSFTNAFTFTNQRGERVGTARITYVCVDPRTSAKMDIPATLRRGLEGIRTA